MKLGADEVQRFVPTMVREYAVLVINRANGRTELQGLTHAEAMARAEQAQREGCIGRVLHVVGSRSYEVDSYPPR